MRIPQMPPDWSRVIEEKPQRFGEAMRDDRYRQLVQQFETKYRHWEKVRFIAREAGLDPELTWTIIALGRQAFFRPLPFTDKNGRQLVYTLPDPAQRELMRIDQQLAGRITFEDQPPLNEEHRERFIINALMEEAIASSMLEGAATTHEVAKEMLRQDRKPRDRSERMVVNNYRAIHFIRENKRTPLTPDFLCEVQAILTENTLDDPSAVGRLRRADERIRVVDQTTNEVLHDPPSADELDERIDRLCAFANDAERDDDQFLHPVIKAILLHFQAAYDHPFCDGNGRTARALFYWSMLRDGYWLFEYLPISRLVYNAPAKYGTAFLYSETDHAFDATYFIVYHLRLIERARRELREHLTRKQAELRRARQLFAHDPELNHRTYALLMHAVQHSGAVYTIESHQRSHGVAYATARSDLLMLTEKGYLQKEKRGVRFEFRPTDLVRRHANRRHQGV